MDLSFDFAIADAQGQALPRQASSALGTGAVVG